MAEKQVKLVFAINGERFEPSGVDPSTTLLEFLRTRTRYKGAKLGCGEGGCGACVVLLSRYDPETGKVNECAVSSCLTLLCSIHLCSVTTTEGLGNSQDGFHSIHQRFSGFHASQCGFCTPGICMSLFSALVNADKSEKPEPSGNFSKIAASEAEKAVAGNVCRCTGYRPILDACKSFAADVDLEDLGLNCFWKKGEKDINPDRLPVYKREGICTFPEFLKHEINSSFNCASVTLNKDPSMVTQFNPSDETNHTSLAEGGWFRPASVDELYRLLNSGNFDSPNHIQMVVGNTASSVYKELELGHKYIDLTGIPELYLIRRDEKGIELGAAVTISRAIEVLKNDDEGLALSSESLIFNKIAEHMNKIASQFVRNTASLGGNLIMAQRRQFPSDIATVLLAVGATVCLQTASGRQHVTLEEFLDQPPCDYRTILLSIYIPCWKADVKTSKETKTSTDSGYQGECSIICETYRGALRPLGNSLPYLNSAFLAQVSSNNMSGEIVLDNIQLAFGAYGVQHAIRARKVENYLAGKPVTASVLLEAAKLLRETIIPKEGTSHPAYRSSLAVAFLFKFLQPLSGIMADPVWNVHTDTIKWEANAEYPNDIVNKFSTISLDKASTVVDPGKRNDNHDMLLSSKQVVGHSKEYRPVGMPVKKVGAEIQASGEAVYVDDIPSLPNCLYGAFINSTKPLAHIKGIKFKNSLASQKITSVISAHDIPTGGKNVGSSSIFGEEPLFADSLTEYAGQPLGVVIAETQKLANIGAKQVIIEYDTEKSELQPILSIDEAVKSSSFMDVPAFVYPNQVGDFSKGMAAADHKILSAEVELGSQYYFYMETQTALAIPDEDNCIVVYTSTQCPENAQNMISKCLGIPNHNVRVITRRVGGGFGGKALKSLPVAISCALSAYKLRRPVRMYLDRQIDMIMAGGRHPMKMTYSVGFKSNGKITALHVDILVNAGVYVDVSPQMPYNIIEHLKKYNWGALSFDVKVCKTNLSSKSAMRGPGETQGSYFAEAIIEHVASVLSMDANVVRKNNLHDFDSLNLFYKGSAGEAYEYTLPSIFDKLVSSESYLHRVAMVHRFNSCHKWKKRGISCMPIVHKVSVRPTPGKVSILNDGSIVVEVGGVELGQGLWTKVKQMAAYALGQLWDDGSEDLLERVRVIQADTLSLIQGGWTAGSTTSESSCEAVSVAGKILIDRLISLKNTLQEQMGSVTWDTLVAQANLQAINLSASAYWVPDFSSTNYLNYGAALSEVEVDLLTGATTILRTDLTYDCGKSLNPAVDLGQVEGAFVQGIGFFMYEEYLTDSDGFVVTDGTWTYKIPTVDTIPKEFNVELLNSGHHENRVLSSKATGEPTLLLAASVHCATREAIRAVRAELATLAGSEISPLSFELGVPATMPVVKELCGLDIVERHLENYLSTYQSAGACHISVN